MDQQEYDYINKQFEYAHNQLDNALHYLYECGSCLRNTHDDRAEVINCVLDGAKKLIEEYADVVDDLRQTWASENYDPRWEDD